MNSQASEYVSVALKAASINSRFTSQTFISVFRNVHDSRALGCFQPEVRTNQKIQKVLAQASHGSLSQISKHLYLLPATDWLQVHAIDEVI